LKDTNRREFLGILPAAAAASAAGLRAAGKKIPVGGHVWVYAAVQPRNDVTPVLDQIFSDMSYAGLDGVELMHNALGADGSVQRIRELSRKYSLPVMGMSYSAAMWDRPRHAGQLEEARTLLGRLAEIGGRTLGTSVGQAKARKTAEQLDAQADYLRKLIELCNANGLKLNLHNHTYEVSDGEYDLKGTLARIPDVKLGPDLDWLVAAGVEPVDFVRRHGKSVIFAHLRDRKSDGSWPEAMGEGNLDYAAYGRAFREIAFDGDLAIELAHPNNFKLTRPLRESWKMSRNYVRRAMGY
jgi:sugar phosphate isomerase/epimerase